MIWKSVLEESDAQTFDISKAKLGHMYHYCRGVACHHRKILSYFGQKLDKENCQACDICLGEVEGVPNALIVAQKIISSVFRQGERFDPILGGDPASDPYLSRFCSSAVSLHSEKSAAFKMVWG